MREDQRHLCEREWCLADWQKVQVGMFLLECFPAQRPGPPMFQLKQCGFWVVMEGSGVMSVAKIFEIFDNQKLPRE